MAPLPVSPKDAIDTFFNYLNKLLRNTVSAVELEKITTTDGAVLQFPEKRCVPIGNGFHLYVGQTVEAVRERRRDRSGKERTVGYTLKTRAYHYRLSEGPTLDAPYVIRWEYNSRELQGSGTFPRHHVQMPATLRCFSGTPSQMELDLEALHLSTGYVILEEVIRFVFNELRVPPRTPRWDNILRQGEKRFRVWTRRDI